MVFLLIPVYLAALLVLVWFQQWLVRKLIGLAFWCGALSTATWVLGNYKVGRLFVRKGWSRLALIHDRVGMYTALYQGLIFATLTISAVGILLTWYKEGSTGPVYLFDVCYVSMFITAILLSFGAGVGLIVMIQERLPKSWIRKVVNPPLILVGGAICFGPSTLLGIFPDEVKTFLLARFSTAAFFWILNGIYLAMSVGVMAWFSRGIKPPPPPASGEDPLDPPL